MKIYLKVVRMWIGGRREAGSAHRQRRRDRRTSRAGARPEITVRPAVGLLPRCRRRPKRCPSSPSPTEGDTSGSVTSGEDRKPVFFEGRKTVLLPLSCLDLERMRVCEQSNPSKQARRLRPIYTQQGSFPFSLHQNNRLKLCTTTCQVTVFLVVDCFLRQLPACSKWCYSVPGRTLYRSSLVLQVPPLNEQPPPRKNCEQAHG